ncbi:MAG: PEP/pyruvate-binding domain-containing protein [Actinomycetes bacterium]
MIRSLADACETAAFGAKAVHLGAAVRAGLPVPTGFAISADEVEGVTCGEQGPLADVHAACVGAGWLDTPVAVRSSAIGEDSEAASFAGAHETVLAVSGVGEVVRAIRRVRASARQPAAVAYRSRHGLLTECRMGVVVQELVDAQVAGVLFTRNPVTGVAERVIEASWGLGEAVVSGMVTPDNYRVDRDGRLLERRLGEKDVSVRCRPGGGTQHVPIRGEMVNGPCLDEQDLAALHALAAACDPVYGSPDHDIEFAFRDRVVFLLQRRPITGG